MKRLLIPSFYFPPYKDVSCVRVAKFSKLLPKNNWNPTIITVHPKYYGNKTIKQFESDLLKINVIKIPYLHFPGNIILLKIFFPFLIFFFLILNKKKFHAVFISGSPFYPFIITPLITKIIRIPMIADFRDSWSFNFGFDGSKGTLLQKVIGKTIKTQVEKITFKYASKVSFATKKLQKEYAQLSEAHKKKFCCIPNGVDIDDFYNVIPTKVSKDKTFVIAGKFYKYTPDVTLNLMKVIKQKENIHLLYIGSENLIFSRLARLLNIQNKITILRYQPYKKVLEYIAGADFAITSTGLPNGVGTKIYDYLYLNKPTICFVPKNSNLKEQFSSSSNILISEAPHEIKKIKNAIEKIYFYQNKKNFFHKDIETRQKSTLVLAELLNNVIK